MSFRSLKTDIDPRKFIIRRWKSMPKQKTTVNESDVSYRDSKGRTLVYFAAKNGDTEAGIANLKEALEASPKNKAAHNQLSSAMNFFNQALATRQSISMVLMETPSSSAISCGGNPLYRLMRSDRCPTTRRASHRAARPPRPGPSPPARSFPLYAVRAVPAAASCIARRRACESARRATSSMSA